MEFRLGRFNGTFFDTNIGDKAYVNCIRGFSAYTGWETIEENTYDVYSREDTNIRLTVDNKTGEETLIQKERIENIDFKQLHNSPFDIRFSVSRETPVDDEEYDNNEWHRNIKKERCSYIRKNLSIDRTVTAGESSDKDSELSLIHI